MQVKLYEDIARLYAPGKGFSDVSFQLYPGEVLGIVGESGSGKTTLLKSISARLAPQHGQIFYRPDAQSAVDLYQMAESQRRRLLRTEWGVVHQHPLEGLRPQVSAGGNIGERLMAIGQRHYGEIRQQAGGWLEDVEIPLSRLDNLPTTFSGGEQQRVNIARGFIVDYPILLLDEPTASLDSTNSAAVVSLIDEAKQCGAAIVGIFHDEKVRNHVSDRLLTMTPPPSHVSTEIPS
ncbi:TPA: ATP-binding cassette domain-containing protein [Yersinia enterocolitica]|nr:ATP-binding cassette domain-containing protein [Yersinia enterocolitica]